MNPVLDFLAGIPFFVLILEVVINVFIGLITFFLFL